MFRRRQPGDQAVSRSLVSRALVALVLGVVLAGCQTSGSGGAGSGSGKIHWPWTKRATVPDAPPGAYDPPSRSAQGADPFLPPVVPSDRELPPPGSRSDANPRSNSVSMAEITV